MGREYRRGVCNRKCTEEILSDQRNTPSNSTDTPLCTSRCEPAGATREGCGRRGVESCPRLGQWTALQAWPAPPVPFPHSSRGDSTVLWGQCGCTLKSHRQSNGQTPPKEPVRLLGASCPNRRQSKPVTRSRPWALTNTGSPNTEQSRAANRRAKVHLLGRRTETGMWRCRKW